MKTVIKLSMNVVVLLAILCTSCLKDGEDGAIGPQGPQGEQGTPGEDGMDGEDASANDMVTTADVFAPVLDEVVGSSTLTRSSSKVFIRYETSQLKPGYAYTLWWGVINQPENCIGTPCGLSDLENPDIKIDFLFVSGRVADDSGNAVFSGELLENDGTSSVNSELGLPIDVGGLWDVEKAEIQMLLRSHGPAVPGEIDTQISSYSGGCNDFLPPFSELPDEVGECAEVQVSVHLGLTN